MGNIDDNRPAQHHDNGRPKQTVTTTPQNPFTDDSINKYLSYAVLMLLFGTLVCCIISLIKKYRTNASERLEAARLANEHNERIRNNRPSQRNIFINALSSFRSSFRRTGRARNEENMENQEPIHQPLEVSDLDDGVCASMTIKIQDAITVPEAPKSYAEIQKEKEEDNQLLSATNKRKNHSTSTISYAKLKNFFSHKSNNSQSNGNHNNSLTKSRTSGRLVKQNSAKSIKTSASVPGNLVDKGSPSSVPSP